MKIIPKFLNGGWVREKNNHPISYDDLGYLTDQITGEKGTLVLPEVTIYDKGIHRDILEKRLQNLRDRSEIDPVTGLINVLGVKSVYPEFDIISGFRGVLNMLYPKQFNLPEYKLVNHLVPNTSPKLSIPQTTLLEGVANIASGYRDIIQYYSSPEYFNKLVSSGLSKEEASSAVGLLLNNLNPRKGPFLGYSPIKIVPKYNPKQNGGYIAELNMFKPHWQGRRIEVWGPDNYTTTVHESAHASTLGVTPKGDSPMYTEELMIEHLPELYKVLKYNLTKVPEADGSEYLKLLLEVRSRAISTQVLAKRNKMSIDEIFKLPESDWTLDMKQLVDTYGKDRAIQITKDILTLTPMLYGTSKQIFNNKNKSMQWRPQTGRTNLR